MSRFIILLITAVFNVLNTAVAQKAVVSANRENVCYLGIPNPLTIMAEGYKCDRISVNTDNGQLKHIENCSYEYLPAKKGLATFYVKSINKRDTLAIAQFRIKEIPPPIAKVAGKTVGTIPKNVLLAQVGIVAVLENFDLNAKFKVTSFRVTITNKSTSTESHFISDSAMFTQEMQDGFAIAEHGDIILIADIHCINALNRDQLLNSIVLTIE